MTLIEKYNEYVKECIKERPAFSGPYEDYYLEFDEWIYNYMIEFAEQTIAKTIGANKFTLYEKELEIFKKEKGL
jgi:DNA-binding XRE family transcriptional regulator